MDKGWSSRGRAKKYPNVFKKNGEYRGGRFSNFKSETVREPLSDDTKARHSILDEIKTRIKQGESLDTITDEIAQREEMKQQFNYYIKNGITDLAGIFKNWYLHYEKNKDNNLIK